MPFTRDEFLGVFETYNTSVWPMQLVLVLLGVGALVLAARGRRGHRRIVFAILATLWMWMGIGYHWIFFTSVNPAAWTFGAAFIVQGVLFSLCAVRERPVTGGPAWWSRVLGGVLIAYALAIYPLISNFSDHAYPRSPTFGLPCPTTIFTFGVLFLLAPPIPRWLLVIPVLWAAVGTSAALSLGIWEDLGLGAAGVVGVVGVLMRARLGRTATASSVVAPFSTVDE